MNLSTLSETLGFRAHGSNATRPICWKGLTERQPRSQSLHPTGKPRGPLIVKLSARPTDQFLMEAKGLTALSIALRAYFMSQSAHPLCIAMERFSTSAWSNAAYRKLGAALAKRHRGPWLVLNRMAG